LALRIEALLKLISGDRFNEREKAAGEAFRVSFRAVFLEAEFARVKAIAPF